MKDFSHQQAINDIALLNEIQNITPLTAAQRKSAEASVARLLAVVNGYARIIDDIALTKTFRPNEPNTTSTPVDNPQREYNKKEEEVNSRWAEMGKEIKELVDRNRTNDIRGKETVSIPVTPEGRM